MGRRAGPWKRLQAAAGRLLDRAHGVSTAADDTRSGPLPGVEHRPYDPSRWAALRVALHGCPVGPGDVFADLGAGKGRVVIQAARRFPFRRVIGVERSPELAAAARANVARQPAAAAARTEIVTADLTRWPPPDDLTIAYTFNSVQGRAFAQTVERLVELVDRRGRPLLLVYVNPVEDGRVMATGRARRLASPPRALRRLGRLPPIHRYELLPVPEGATRLP